MHVITVLLQFYLYLCSLIVWIMNKRLIFTLLHMFIAIVCSAIEQDVKTVDVLKQKGDAYYNAGRLPEALEHYTMALDRAKTEKNDSIYNACIGNIGNIYATTGDIRHAVFYFIKGYKASVEQKDAEMQSKFIVNIVKAYCMMGDVKNAKSFFNLQTQLPIKNKIMQQYFFLSNQGMIALADNNIQMAEYYLNKTTQFAKERGLDEIYVLSSLSLCGDLMVRKKEYDKAIGYYTLCLDSTKNEAPSLMTVNIYRQLSAVYDSIGKHDEAKKYKNISLAMSDSIFNRNQMNMASNKLFEYENYETQTVIDDLVYQNRARMAALIWAILLIALLTAFYFVLRRKNKTLLDAQQRLVFKNQELQEIDKTNKQLLKQYVDTLDKINVEKQNNIDESSDEHTTKDSHVINQPQRNDIPLNDEQKKRLLNKISEVMADVETISRSDFNMSMLAEKTGSNSKYISWIINETYGKNFKTLLNECRIREASKRLTDTENYGNMTIQAIYEELGYNSAASFLQAFKKINGMTPSLYQKLAKKKQEINSSI